MNLLEENYEYAKATATAEAVRIAKMIDRKQDIPDIVQDLLLHCVRNIGKFNATRSQPRTFIALLIRTAGKMYLRRHFRKMSRNGGEILLEELPQEGEIEDEHETTRQRQSMLDDYIEAMPEGEAKEICRKYFIEGELLYNLAMFKVDEMRRLKALVFEAMFDYALEIGLVREDQRPESRRATLAKTGEQIQQNSGEDETPPRQRPPP